MDRERRDAETADSSYQLTARRGPLRPLMLATSVVAVEPRPEAATAVSTPSIVLPLFSSLDTGFNFGQGESV